MTAERRLVKVATIVAPGIHIAVKADSSKLKLSESSYKEEFEG
jgi:hypothetical protein